MTPYSFNSRTWIEPEERAYGRRGATFARKAQVRIEGTFELRIVRCSIPDTYTSIPARRTVAGKTVQGYLWLDQGTLMFRENGPLATEGK